MVNFVPSSRLFAGYRIILSIQAFKCVNHFTYYYPTRLNSSAGYVTINFFSIVKLLFRVYSHLRLNNVLTL